MSKVFVSYRHVDPDQQLAQGLVAALEAANHSVFWDTKLKVGQRWADETGRNLALSREKTETLETAAHLHDIGLASVPQRNVLQGAAQCRTFRAELANPPAQTSPDCTTALAAMAGVEDLTELEKD